MELEVGDIGGVKGVGFLNKLQRKLMSPDTDREHFFIIWARLQDDWLILESISSKGISVGKLSWYANDDVIFYRVDCPEDLRKKAPWGLIDWGRSTYDYFLIPKLALESVLAFCKILVKEHKIRKLTAHDFRYNVNRQLICTEAVETAYLSVGISIVEPGILPIPNSFKEAELNGTIFVID